MGRRGRKRGAAGSGKGAAQQRKERRLGIDGTGLGKPLLDAMQEAAVELHHVGIGVCVQEEQREREIADSLWTEREGLAGWKVAERARLARVAGEHRAAAEMWARRIEQCAEHVAQNASDRDVARAAAAR